MAQIGLSSPETVSTLLIVTTMLQVFGLGVTSFRLWFRYHIRRFWWDDFWAILVFLSNAVSMVAMWLLASPLGNINTEALPTPAQSRRTHIISFWLNMVFYTCSIWFARLSIICSVVRIVPPARNVSVAAFSSGGVFLCMWIYMLIGKSATCSSDESWYNAPAMIVCPIPEWLAISEVCTDALSDIILVIFPLCLLWHVKLPQNQRIMVLSVFSTSLLVSVVSAVHTSYIIPRGTFIGGITANIGSAVSLIICNLLVIVTFFYRVTRNGRDITAGVFGKKSESTNRLTTIDLECARSSWFASTRTTAGAETNLTATVTATNISSVVFAHPSDTFGSMPAASGSGLPDTVPPLPSIITRQ